ncbi:MAG: DUF1513 domain-containing protein [Rhizobiaceae bacterium]|nr:DUF1513 domain-containing protein [Rhizobiaceae bacterium]
MNKLELDRRAFLLGAGASLSASLLAKPAFAKLRNQDAVFASGFKSPDGNFGLALLSEDGELIQSYPLPARGHGIAANQNSNWAIIFARRPENFALAFDPKTHLKPVLFSTPADRHFYGHGAFSTDGRLLYASENDFENGVGKIGIYDAHSNFVRIGEFNSAGIGPHEIIMMPGGKTLCVANGGIKTHPQFPRTKLNLDSMRSSIVFIDAYSGSVIEVHQLPDNWSLLSLRHMATDQKGIVWIGGQYEGSAFDQAPLVAKVSMRTSLQFIDLPSKHNVCFKNYIGSVTINDKEGLVALSSPKGGQVLILDSQSGNVVKSHFTSGVCGLSPSQKSFIASSERGRFGNRNHDVNWDNHIGRLQ